MRRVPKATATLSALTALTAASLLLLSAGCGGGAGHASRQVMSGPHLPASPGGISRGVGSTSFTVRWPERNPTRLIPVTSESIAITLTPNGFTPKGPIPAVPILVRPAPGQPLTTTVTVSNLELGRYTVSARAYPNPSGIPGSANVAQASTTPATEVNVDIKDGVNPGVTLTMDTTITQIVVTRPTLGNLKAGQTLQLGAQAVDASGASVLTLPANISYTLTSGAGVVSLDPVTHLVTALAEGTAVVTVRDSESGKSGTTVINVVQVGLSTTAPWSKFRGDLQNTGHAGPNVVGNATTGTEKWVRSSGVAVGFSSPAVDSKGDVYIGSYDGTVYAYKADGTPKWTRATGGQIDSSPAISRDGSVYIGSADGNLYALSAETGSVIWTAPVPAAVTGGPTLTPDGVVYFGTAAPDNKIYAADALTGAIIGTFVAATDGIDSSPALSQDNRTLYFGSRDGSVYAVDISTPSAMALKWQFATGGQIYVSSPVVATNGDVYIGATDGKLYGLTPGGALKPGFPFTVPSGAPIYGSPALSLDGSRLYFGVFDNVSGNDENRVYALGTVNGDEIWEADVQGPISASPTIGQDGTVYIGAYDGSLYAFDGATGGLKSGYPFSTGAGSTIDSSVGLGLDGTVYFGDFNGKVHAVK